MEEKHKIKFGISRFIGSGPVRKLQLQTIIQDRKLSSAIKIINAPANISAAIMRLQSFDNRFLYVTQTILRSRTPTTNVLIRVAIVSSEGIVNPEKVIHDLDDKIVKPNLPVWIKKWADSEKSRPWPPSY